MKKFTVISIVLAIAIVAYLGWFKGSVTSNDAPITASSQNTSDSAAVTTDEPSEVETANISTLPELPQELPQDLPQQDNLETDNLAESLIGETYQTNNPGITVNDPWVRAMPPGASASAAYMTINNIATDPVLITGVESPQFEEASIHETRLDGDIASMHAIDNGVPLPAGGSVEMKPNGIHIMLMGARSELSVDDEFTVIFTLRDGAKVTVPVVVRAEN